MKIKVTEHAGKGSRSEILPSKHALFQLSGGDPAQRTLGNYAKATPNILQTGPDFLGVQRGGDT